MQMDCKRKDSRRIYGYLCQNENDEFIYCCRMCDFECTSSNQLEEHTMTHKQMSNLDIKCMENIFKFLSSDDLAAMSLTCQTFNVWSRGYFCRKRQSGTVIIKADNNIQFDFRNAKFYEIHFSSLIPYVRVYIENEASLEQTFKFIKKNCYTIFKSFELWASESDFEMNHVHLIQDQIKDLEILDINYVSRFDLFTKYTPNLRALMFKFYGLDMPFDTAFMNEYFPHLKALIFGALPASKIDLTTFLNRNPQIQAVIVENCLLAIKSFLLTNVKLPLLIVKLQFIHDYPKIRDEFEICCRQKNIKSLELVFNYPDPMNVRILRQIFDSEYIEGLHFNLNNLLNSQHFKVQSNLKRLCLCIDTDLKSHWMNDLARMIVNFMPNLDELRIEVTIGWLMESIRNILLPIISRVKTLSHIYLNCHRKMKISQLDVMKLDETRSALIRELEDHRIVSIHLNNELTYVIPSLPVASSILIILEPKSCMSCSLCSSDGQKNLNFLRNEQIIQF